MALNFVQIFINVSVCLVFVFCSVMFLLKTAQLVRVVRRARAIRACKKRAEAER